MNKEFIAKLSSVQTELKAPKGKRNTFGNYNYRSCEDILEAAKPILEKHGLLLTLSDAIFMTPAGWHFVEATATITDGENVVSVSALARETEEKKGFDSSQITGMASSYARKYCLSGLFLLDDTKDADTDEYAEVTKSAKSEKPKKETVPMINKEQKMRITNLCVDIKKPMTDITTAYKVDTLNEITEAQADKIIERLEQLKREKEAAKK